MVHVLVSLTAADAVDGSARQVEGVLHRLPEGGRAGSAGGPGAPADDGQPFCGWLELLGHLERLITPGAQAADPVEAGSVPAAPPAVDAPPAAHGPPVAVPPVSATARPGES